MFDKKLKKFSVTALILSCSLFSSLSYSDEVCFINLSNTPIQAHWVIVEMSVFKNQSVDGEVTLTKNGNSGSCVNIPVSSGGMHGIYRIMATDGGVAPGGEVGQLEVNGPALNTWLGGPSVTVPEINQTTQNSPGNGSITVFNPFVGSLDLYLGYVSDAQLSGNGSYTYFEGMLLGSPPIVRVTAVQEGSDSVFRIFFQDFTPPSPPPPPPAPIYQPDPDQPPGYIPGY